MFGAEYNDFKKLVPGGELLAIHAHTSAAGAPFIGATYVSQSLVKCYEFVLGHPQILCSPSNHFAEQML